MKLRVSAPAVLALSLLVASACASPAQAPATAAPASAPTVAPASAPTTKPAAPAQATAAPAAKKASEQLTEAAIRAGELNDKREGELNLWSTTPREDNLPQFVEAFNKRFGLKVKVKQVSMSTGNFVTRVKTGAQAGKVEADMGQGSISSLTTLEEAGLLDKYDWLGAMGQEFPDIKKRVERVMPAYQGKALDYRHLIYVTGFRTDRIKREEIPTNWEDLSNPKFKGRFALSQEGYPFSYLSPFWGSEKTIRVATKLRDNGARFYAGSPAVSNALRTGEVDIALTTLANMVADQAKGLPIDWVLPDELAIVQSVFISPKGAPHPNLARLWGAWITTEGRPLLGKTEGEELAWPDEDYAIAKKVKELGVKVRAYDTREQAEMTVQMEGELSKLYARN